MDAARALLLEVLKEGDAELLERDFRATTLESREISLGSVEWDGERTLARSLRQPARTGPDPGSTAAALDRKSVV